jgi:hypothetical protein
VHSRSGLQRSAEVDYVVRLEFDPPLPEPFSYRVAWPKCDMLATVGFERLDLFHTARDQTGKRRYLHPKLTGAELERVKPGVLHALGFRNLTLTSDQQYWHRLLAAVWMRVWNPLSLKTRKGSPAWP